MQAKEKVGGGGRYYFIHRGPDGERKLMWNDNRLGCFLRKHGLGSKGRKGLGFWDYVLHPKNLVTDDGLAGVAGQIGGAGSPAYFDYLAVGIGTTAANKADTTLESEIVDSGLARAQDASPTRETTVETDDTAVQNYQWSVTGTKAITEAGVLNAASTGVLLARQVFAAVNVANNDTFEAIYKFQITTT